MALDRYSLACALLVSVPACSGQDIDIGHGAAGRLPPMGTAGTMDGGGAMPGAPNDAAPRAIVIRSADLPPSSSTTTGGSATTGSAASSSTSAGSGVGGTTIDPDLRYLFIGSGPPTCGNPAAGDSCGFFRVSIRIPSVLFAPGLHYLADNRILSTYSIRGPARDTGDCSGEGGDFLDGTVEILDITGGVAYVRLANTAKLGFDADGTYAAVQCL